MLLNKFVGMVKDEAQKVNNLSQPGPLHAVLAVPVWFVADQRARLLDSTRISGVDCLGLINETTAAALEWGVFRGGQALMEGRNIVAFVDCGQSATTITVVAYGDQTLEVLGHVWDACLGGRDFDYALYEHFAAEVQRKYGCDVEGDVRSKLKLLQSCEKLKKVLSANASTHFECDLGEFDVRFPDVQREWFEALVSPLLQRLQALISQARAIPLPAGGAVQAVEVLGGASRTPCVKAALAAAFGVPLSTQLNAEEAVARGCGIMAAQLSPTMRGQVRRWKVKERHPIPISWSATVEGDSTGTDWQPAFAANTEVPAKAPVTLSVPAAAPRASVRMTYDVAALPPFMVPHAEPLEGRWDVLAAAGNGGDGPVPDMVPVEVDILLDSAGLLSLESRRVKGSPGCCLVSRMPTTKVDRLQELQRAQAVEARLREMDEMVRLTAESKNALESYVITSMRALQGDLAPYLTPADGAEFQQALEGTEQWLYEEGEREEYSTYTARLSALQAVGDAAEQRRSAHAAAQQGLQDLGHWLAVVQQETVATGGGGAAALRAAVEEAAGWAGRIAEALRRAPTWEAPPTSRDDIDNVRSRVVSALQAAQRPVPPFPAVGSPGPTADTRFRDPAGSQRVR
eukprot:EG_transcript_3386